MKHSSLSTLFLLLLVTLFRLASIAQQIPCPVTVNTTNIGFGSNQQYCEIDAILDNASGATFINQSPDVTHPVVVLDIFSGQLTNEGLLWNQAGAVIESRVGGYMNNSGTILNDGYIGNDLDRTFDNSGALINAGDISNGGTLNNASTGVLFNSGYFQNSASLNNDGALRIAAGGTFVSQVSGFVIPVEINNSSTGVIDNYGTFTTDYATTFFNQGKIFNRLGGTLTVVNGIDTGVGGTISNAGTFDSYGNLYLNMGSALDNYGTLTSYFGASIYLSQYASIANHGGGVLNNFGTISNSGLISNEAAGTINNSGDILSLHLSNSNGGTINNSGTIENFAGGFVSASIDNHGTLNIANGGSLTNMAGGALINYSDGQLFNSGALINEGHNNGITNYGYMENDGTVHLLGQAGTGLWNASGGMIYNFGTITTDPGSTLTNAGTLADVNTIDNYGSIDNQKGGWLDVSHFGGVLNNYADTGTIDNRGLITNVGTVTNFVGGTITNWSGGELDNAATFTNDVGGTIVNQGGAIINNDHGGYAQAVINNYGSISNQAGGTINNAFGDIINNYGTITNSGAISNSGTMYIDHGGVLTNQAGGIYQQGDGSTVVDGQLNSVNTAIQVFGGTLAGNGTISAPDVHMDGTLSPGDLIPGSSIGLLSMFGDYTQGASGTFLAEIAGVSSYDQLFVGNVATFDGTLDVMLLNGFTPSVGDSFRLIDYLHSIGSFATLDLPILPAGEAWTWQYVDSYGFVLSVYQTPEPSTLLMLGSALSLMGYRFRLRRNRD